MDYRLRQLIQEQAARAQLGVAENFFTTLDAYIERHFRTSNAPNQVIIQTYLAKAAIQIAQAEGKRLLEGDDGKAAIWLFHLPEQPDDPCAAAGNRALAEEARRQRFQRGLLNESFSNFLDRL